MRSSNRCSPTSSTDLWLTCRPGCSQQIVRGRCWRRSPTTCSAPPGLCPGRPTRWPAGPPCVVTWSTSRVGSPDPKANERCIYPFTGPGPGTGICCGTACSTTTPDKSPSDPDHPGPQRPYQETTVDTLGQASSSTTPAPWPTRQRHDQPEARSTSQSVHGFRLSSSATLSRSAWKCNDRSVPFGKYCRSNPLVFSLVPRCHGECGSQKYTSIPVATEKSACRAISFP